MDLSPSETLSPIYGINSLGERVQLPQFRRPSPTPEWSFDTSEGSILTPIATHLSPIPTYSWEACDSMSTVVPETPMVEDPSWTESQPSMLLETPDLEDPSSMVTDSELLVVPVLPDLQLDSELLVPVLPDSQLDSELIIPDTPDSQLDSELYVPDTPGYESPPPTVVPETPRVKRRRCPVEETEWFKEFLIFLLPGMADLI